MPPAPRAPSCRRARRSAPAIPCSSASAGSDSLPVIPGRCAASNPESRDSGFSLREPRNDMQRANLFPHMLREEFHTARPGDLRAGLVVAGALVAVKTVLRAGIDEDLDLRPF